MTYDSFNGKADGARGYPLLTINNEFIYMGDDSEPWLAGPSKMDVERIRALYPKRQVPMFAGIPLHNPKRSVNASSTESEQPWINITISGVTTTSVMPMPSDFPKFVNDSRAVEIAKKYSADHPNWVTEDERPAPPAAPAPFGSPGPLGQNITKRWYSVPLDQDALPEGQRAWQACKDGKCTINYCFEDAASHKELAEVFAKGLAKWAPAMHVSSLDFAPDDVCTGDMQTRCLCTTPGVEETTLHIILTEQGGPEATVGYLPPSVTNHDPSKPRHHITWPNDPHFFGKAAPLMMAHEIGKAARLTILSWRRFESVSGLLTLLQDTWLALDTSTNVPMYATRSSSTALHLVGTMKRRRKSKPLVLRNQCSHRTRPSRRGWR